MLASIANYLQSTNDYVRRSEKLTRYSRKSRHMYVHICSTNNLHFINSLDVAKKYDLIIGELILRLFY